MTQIPTPPLQKSAIFINFFFPALALVLVALRSYARVKTRQWGLGMLNILIADFAVNTQPTSEETC